MSESETFIVIKLRPSDVHESGYVHCPIAIYAKEGTKLREESALCFVWTVHETDAGIDGIYIQRTGAETAVAVSQSPNTVLKQHNSIGKAAKFMNYVCRNRITCRERFDREMLEKADADAAQLLKEKADADAAQFDKELDAAEEFYGAGKHAGKHSTNTIHTIDEEPEAESSRVGSQPAELPFYDMNMYAADLAVYAADLGMYADDELGYPSDDDKDISAQSSPACSTCHDTGCDTFLCPGA
ncbi:hypothetical protein C8R43DRAFT_950768 [Mycena crocata]|nr:hypothetical protein C8R43DRAFT_950768 [Mycena crocata]